VHIKECIMSLSNENQFNIWMGLIIFFYYFLRLYYRKRWNDAPICSNVWVLSCWIGSRTRFFFFLSFWLYFSKSILPYYVLNQSLCIYVCRFDHLFWEKSWNKNRCIKREIQKKVKWKYWRMFIFPIFIFLLTQVPT
jgi:hypothetical protein